MNKMIIYIHGQGGSAAEAEHYQQLFPGCRVLGFDYRSQTPWDAKDEFTTFFRQLSREYGTVILIANSLGAYLAMSAGIEEFVCRAYFISPIIAMEQLIRAMMAEVQVSEAELRKKGVISTGCGPDLSWEYLTYIREHPLRWKVLTDILYGGKDSLTDYETMAAFAREHGARLTVMENGEHWFHTEEQMVFLDAWFSKQPQSA
ncbi:MAG: alpha/beta hydrolase [bacterium]|nr:alpha/beta hydrolase [bacterium]